MILLIIKLIVQVLSVVLLFERGIIHFTLNISFSMLLFTKTP
jgi:hypothetical protein